MNHKKPPITTTAPMQLNIIVNATLPDLGVEAGDVDVGFGVGVAVGVMVGVVAGVTVGVAVGVMVGVVAGVTVGVVVGVEGGNRLCHAARRSEATLLVSLVSPDPSAFIM